MKVTAYIPGWGTSTYEAASVSTELAALEGKFPDKAGSIVVREANQRKLSDTERDAEDEGGDQ